MSKKKMNTKKGGTASKRKRGMGGGPGGGALMSFAQYRRLLSDPCGAPLAPAPFAGMGSSYLVRTINTLPLNTGAGGLVGDAVVQVSPWNFPVPYVLGTGGAGTLLSLVNAAGTNFVTEAAVVKSYRPVAACLKWVPSGPVATRSGVVGLAYSPAKVVAAGDSVNALTVMSQTMTQATSGTEAHEVRWLPSFEDQRFGRNGEVSVSGVGSMLVVLKNVDCIDGSFNGYLEVTVAWEWEPAADTRFGVVPALSTPQRSTLNEVLATLGDVGTFVLRGAMGVATREAYRYAAGVANRRAPAMLTY